MVNALLTAVRFAWLMMVVAANVFAHWLRTPSRRRMSGPERVRRVFETVGGTYLKFGQVLSLQPDVLSPAVCDALFDLLDRVPPFPYSEVERTFYEDLGSGPNEIFDQFESQPMASASIGQVHVAELNGRKLAVKVRRPAVERVFAADLHLMRAVAWIIRSLRLTRWSWLVRAIEEFDSWTREELDYRYEARFMAALATNAADNPREAVPEVVRELSTARILVADFLEGPTVLDLIRATSKSSEELLAESAAPNFKATTFARNIVTNFVSDAFHNGLFHADLHPANLIVLPDNVVGYVDFGITGSLSRYSRRNMVALTLALTRADIDGLVVFFLRISTLDPGADVEAFRRGVRDLLEIWFEPGTNGRRLKTTFTTVMVDMLHLSRQTGIWPTPDVVRYIRSVITADGLVSRFAPDLDAGALLEQVCEETLVSELWRTRLAPENLADWTSSGVRLLQEGPVALNALLEQLSGGTPTSNEVPGNRRPPDTRSRLLLAFTSLVAAALASLGGAAPVWGFNMMTAELAVALAAGTMFLATFRR